MIRWRVSTLLRKYQRQLQWFFEGSKSYGTLLSSGRGLYKFAFNKLGNTMDRGCGDYVKSLPDIL